MITVDFIYKHFNIFTYPNKVFTIIQKPKQFEQEERWGERENEEDKNKHTNIWFFFNVQILNRIIITEL